MDWSQAGPAWRRGPSVAPQPSWQPNRRTSDRRVEPRRHLPAARLRRDVLDRQATELFRPAMAGLAVSKQVHRTKTKLILQIAHQPAPLARARYAGMYQHDHRVGRARFEIIDLDRRIVGHPLPRCPGITIVERRSAVLSMVCVAAVNVNWRCAEDAGSATKRLSLALDLSVRWA